MKLKFYKEKNILFRHCREPGCPASYRPERGSWQDKLGLCIKHRRIYLREQHLKWWAKQSPEYRKQYRQRVYSGWLKWVKNNLERRRTTALTSYHKHKGYRRRRRNKARRAYYVRTGR